MLLELTSDATGYEVEIAWKSLVYKEQGQEGGIKIYIDPPSCYGMPFAFYIPGNARWHDVMPEWAGDRREEIVARIKDECSHYHAEWVEG